eukprot:IDg15996t1
MSVYTGLLKQSCVFEVGNDKIKSLTLEVGTVFLFQRQGSCAQRSVWQSVSDENQCHMSFRE